MYNNLSYPYIQCCISALVGAASCCLKQNVGIQKKLQDLFFCVLVMTPTNSLFDKTSHLKTNEVFKLRVCKLML